jgi:membrane-anchored mycosin MYCP
MITVFLAAAMLLQTGAADDLAEAQRTLFEKLEVTAAWAHTRGDADTLVGVIDSGFDFFHPSLKGKLIPGSYYAGGYHPECYENLAHGTLVAGLIVASDPNGVSGFAPGCRVVTAAQGSIDHVMVKLSKSGDPAGLEQRLAAHRDELQKFGAAWSHYQIAGAASAVRDLVQRGVKVINVSGALMKSLCQSADDWQALEDAFADAAEQDVVIVLAAGNSAQETSDYPGSSETVIIAGGVMRDDRRWEQSIPYAGKIIKQGSNYGSRLTAMAPIENVVACQPHERRFYESDDGPFGAVHGEFLGPHQVVAIGGTSSAAPIVSALVALVRSARPDLDARDVVKLVERGCDDLGPPGFDTDTGYGRVNFGKTLALAMKAPR